MKTTLSALVLLVILASGLSIKAQKVASRSHTAAEAFWSRFQPSVANGNVDAVASMTKFPLGMPYGVKNVRTKADFKKRYAKIFDAQTRKCFATAKPAWDDSSKKGSFSVSCGEAMMYWFEPVNGEYKFATVDNINE